MKEEDKIKEVIALIEGLMIEDVPSSPYVRKWKREGAEKFRGLVVKILRKHLLDL